MSSVQTTKLTDIRNLFHLYSVLAIVIFLLIVFIAFNTNDAVHAWTRLPSWLSNSTVLGLFTLVSLFLAGFVTSIISMRNSEYSSFKIFGGNNRVSLGALFVVSGLFLVISALFAYRDFNFWPAFWSAVLSLVCMIIHAVLVFRIKPSYTLLVVPVLVLLLIIVYYLWNMADQSEDFGSSSYANMYSIKYKSL